MVEVIIVLYKVLTKSKRQGREGRGLTYLKLKHDMIIVAVHLRLLSQS